MSHIDPLPHNQTRFTFSSLSQGGPLLAAAAWILLGVLGLSIGYLFDQITLRSLLFVILPVAGLAIFKLPYPMAIATLIIYIGIEGMAKLLTNYNPVVHVGADLLIYSIILRWTVGWFVRINPFPKFLPPLAPIFFLLWAWFFIAWFNPYSLSLFASAAAAKIYISLPALFWFGYFGSKDKNSVRLFMAAWVVVALIQIPTGLYQWEIGWARVAAFSPAYKANLEKFLGFGFRPFGTTSQPGAASVLVALGFPFVLYFIATLKNRLLKLLLFASIPLFILLLVYCQVRTMQVKVIIASFLFIFYLMVNAKSGNRLKVISTSVILLCVTVYGLASWLPSILAQGSQGAEKNFLSSRLMSITDPNQYRTARAGALDRILKHLEIAPLGIGLSRTGAAGVKFLNQIKADPHFDHHFFTDNTWAAILIDLGIPGAILITIIVLSVLVRGVRDQFVVKDLELKKMGAVMSISLLLVTLALWAGEGILYNPEGGFYWFFAGVLFKLRSLDLPAKETSESTLHATIQP